MGEKYQRKSRMSRKGEMEEEGESYSCNEKWLKALIKNIYLFFTYFYDYILKEPSSSCIINCSINLHLKFYMHKVY